MCHLGTLGLALTTYDPLQELELKARQFQMLLQPLPSLQAAPNVNALWAGALVEELCRHGIHTFGVAPGMLLLMLFY